MGLVTILPVLRSFHRSIRFANYQTFWYLSWRSHAAVILLRTEFIQRFCVGLMRIISGKMKLLFGSVLVPVPRGGLKVAFGAFFFNSSSISTFSKPEAWQIGFQHPATEMMEGIVQLHHDIMGILGIILGFVSLLMIAGIAFFSSTKLEEIIGTNFHIAEISRQRYFSGSGNNYHTVLETIWTIIPTVILLGIATPSFSLIYALDEIVEPGLTIRITGHQWYWTYEYPEGLKEPLDFSYPPYLNGEMEAVFDRMSHLVYTPEYLADKTPEMLARDRGSALLATWFDAANRPPTPYGTLRKEAVMASTLSTSSFDTIAQQMLARTILAYSGSNTWVPFHAHNCTSPVDVKDWDYTPRGAILALATFDDTIDWDAMAKVPVGRAPDHVGPTFDRPTGSFVGYYLPKEDRAEKLKVIRQLPPLVFDSRMIPDEELQIDHFRLLSTDEFVCLPINTTVRLLITSDDVLHSWAVPSFGVKIDAVPGRVNEYFLRVKEAGLYFGQCSEICGVNHAFMPITIRAVDWGLFTFWWQSMAVDFFYRGELEAPFTIEYNKDVFCSLADEILKELTCDHGFVGHELHRLTLNAFYDGGYEVTRFLVYRQMVASIAIHTTGLSTYSMVYDKPDLELLAYTIIRNMGFWEKTAGVYNPAFFEKHYRHLSIPHFDVDFNPVWGLERVSIFQPIHSLDAFYLKKGDLPAAKPLSWSEWWSKLWVSPDRTPPYGYERTHLQPYSWTNMYPLHSMTYPEWRNSTKNLPNLPGCTDKLLMKELEARYPTNGACYEAMVPVYTRPIRELMEQMRVVNKVNKTHVDLDRMVEKLDLKEQIWRAKNRPLGGFIGWPATQDPRQFMPLGTEYYIEQGLYKKGAIPNMPKQTSRIKE